jgi:hypothetical protein
MLALSDFEILVLLLFRRCCRHPARARAVLSECDEYVAGQGLVGGSQTGTHSFSFADTRRLSSQV